MRYLEKLVLTAALALGTIFAVFRKGKNAGEAEAKAEDNEAALGTLKEAKDVKENVDRLSSDAVTERLRDKWTRD